VHGRLGIVTIGLSLISTGNMPQQEKTFLTFFLGTTFELALSLSWKKIELKEIEEEGGHILIQVETDQATELFDLYEHLFCTSFKSSSFRSRIIYFDTLFNKTEEVRDRIYTDLKRIAVSKTTDRFQL